MHPMIAHRLQVWRLSNFALDRLPSAEDVYVFHGVARENPKDERLFALAEVRDLTPVRDEDGRLTALPEFERMYVEALEGLRGYQAHRAAGRRLQWNRVLLHVWPQIDLSPEEMKRPARAPGARRRRRSGLEMLLVRGRLREADGVVRDRVLRFFSPGRDGRRSSRSTTRRRRPLEPLVGERAARRLGARGAARPHPRGGAEAPRRVVRGARPRRVRRPRPGRPADRDERRVRSSSASCATSPSATPRGCCGSPCSATRRRRSGSLAEPECRRIIAALDLAERLGVPVEWFALSAGAKIAMDSGTENMDWIADVLRRIIEFTQRGGELNVVVTGINVGAQPYWNAEATMLMHTRGILS